MNADGVWTIEMKTPLGRQRAVLRLATDGGALTGTIESGLGSGAISDGAIDGDALSWVAAFTLPRPVVAHFQATIDDDLISGVVNLGRTGDAPFKGARDAG